MRNKTGGHVSLCADVDRQLLRDIDVSTVAYVSCLHNNTLRRSGGTPIASAMSVCLSVTFK